jgi:hypothetical protein
MFISEKSLQDAIDIYILYDKKQYNKEEAEILFNLEWEKIV